MTIIIEDGSGVSGANSYVDRTFVTAYLTDRNRLTQNGWSTAGDTIQDAACVAATDYIEDRFSLLFRGIKEFRDLRVARSVLTLTAQPSDTETVVIGSITYTFNTSLGGTNSILIGASASASVGNLINAINGADGEEGVGFGTGTVKNVDAGAQVFFDDSLLGFAEVSGTPGNAVATTETLGSGSWSFTTMNGGTDRQAPQPLSFPKRDLFDRDSIRVIGIPTNLKHAAAEYAVRSVAGILAPDPDVDPTGGSITLIREKVGPLDTTTEYLPGTSGSGTLPAYPAADRLLRDYLRPAGVVIRG